MVTDIKAPKFVNSSFKASKRSVSFIFKVCKPVKLQEIPSEKQVTAIVCAMSGAFLRFIAKVSALVLPSFFKIIQSFPKSSCYTKMGIDFC